MRQPKGQQWSVEVSPQAWEQLGVVPSDIFRQIRKELDGVAELASQQVFDDPGSRSGHALSLKVGGFAALYRLDADAQRVVLEEVTQTLEGANDPRLGDPARPPP